jgi:succinate-acetate transporter protein
MPLGFYTIAIATIMVSSFQIGVIGPAEQRNVAFIILPAFVLQLIVGIACIAARDAIAATLMTSFAGSWLADALVYLFGAPGKSSASAVFFFTFTGFVAMMATAARPKAALFAVLVVAMPRFLFSGLAAATGNDALTKTAGAFGYALAAVAIYTAWALLLEDVRGHTVLPVGRSGPAKDAIEGSLAAQLTGYEHLAGVRRTL